MNSFSSNLTKFSLMFCCLFAAGQAFGADDDPVGRVAVKNGDVYLMEPMADLITHEGKYADHLHGIFNITSKDGKLFVSGGIHFGQEGFILDESMSVDVPVECTRSENRIVCPMNEEDCGSLILTYSGTRDNYRVTAATSNSCFYGDYLKKVEFVSMPEKTYIEYRLAYEELNYEFAHDYFKAVLANCDNTAKFKAEQQEWDKNITAQCGKSAEGLSGTALIDYYICRQESELVRANELFETLPEDKQSKIPELETVF